MDIFKNFKKIVIIREVQLDNHVFQLHYRVTCLMLAACAALVASKQHFGDPIDCIIKDDVPQKIMDTYCWIHSTFTLPNSCNKTVGLEVAHPCVEKSQGMNGSEERIYHRYYQWVYFVLAFQAGLFYLPHIIWKSSESQLLSTLTEKMRKPVEKSRPMDQLVKYLSDENRSHRKYFQNYYLCEFSNLLNVIAQVFLVDSFLGGTFTTYGWDVLNMDDDDRSDPMALVFPKMTKCTFHRYGPSGDVNRYDALCILPVNILNEKIYIIMWFWFLLLASISALFCVYRFFTITQPSFRYSVLTRRAVHADRHGLRYILRSRKDPGEWFILYMLCKNMDSDAFKDLINKLEKSLRDLAAQKRAGKDIKGLGLPRKSISESSKLDDIETGSIG